MPRTLRRLIVAIECPTSARGRQLVRRNAPMAAMESSCVVVGVALIAMTGGA